MACAPAQTRSRSSCIVEDTCPSPEVARPEYKNSKGKNTSRVAPLNFDENQKYPAGSGRPTDGITIFSSGVALSSPRNPPALLGGLLRGRRHSYMRRPFPIGLALAFRVLLLPDAARTQALVARPARCYCWPAPVRPHSNYRQFVCNGVALSTKNHPGQPPNARATSAPSPGFGVVLGWRTRQQLFTNALLFVSLFVVRSISVAPQNAGHEPLQPTAARRTCGLRSCRGRG